MIIEKQAWEKQSVFRDLIIYFFPAPLYDTLIKFSSIKERVRYSNLVLQRLHVEVSEYHVLNIHKIGINVPPEYIFEELLQWNGNSHFWPNQIARVRRINDQLENIVIFTLGIEKIRIPWFTPLQLKIKPLFNLSAIKIQHVNKKPEPSDSGYLLYECSGGYPIGIFSLYVRKSVPDEKENETAQLFSIVAFNFYGKKNWFNANILNPVWKKIHNRVSANVLNRIKQIMENKFKGHIKTGKKYVH